MDGFKQRIIGALVLISLAVIFVPMLLDEPHEERTTRSIEIPEEPPFPEVRIETAREPETVSAIEQVPEPESPPMQIESSSTVDTGTAAMTADDTVRQAGQDSVRSRERPDEPAEDLAPVEPAAAPEVAAPAKPELSSPQAVAEEPQAMAEQPQAGGYLVQLGSFGSDSNAKRLMGSVKEAGFAAHTTSVSSDGQSFTRVFAGPFPDKAAADLAKAKLDKQFDLNTLVIVNDK